MPSYHQAQGHGQEKVRQWLGGQILLDSLAPCLRSPQDGKIIRTVVVTILNLTRRNVIIVDPNL